MKLKQARKLLRQLAERFGDFAEVDFRIVAEVPDNRTASDVQLFAANQGFAAHPERSAFSEIEVVITEKVWDGDP
jgi:hypothetical protein